MSVAPRKSLGQHFLNDRSLLARIAEVTGASTSDVVLEIGPGPGGLTGALLDRGATVVAIERDERFADALRRQFAKRDFVLIQDDALAIDWPEVVAPWTAVGKRWRVAGNIPYNITSPLLAKALDTPFPESVTFLVQREVADRLAARAGDDDYGALSVNIQAAATVTRALTVSKAAFRPPPKVDSAVVHLVPRATPAVPATQLAALRRLVVSLFSYRRKRMGRALREASGLDASVALAVLQRAGIDPDIRPEEVDVESFARLLQAMRGGES